MRRQHQAPRLSEERAAPQSGLGTAPACPRKGPQVRQCWDISRGSWRAADPAPTDSPNATAELRPLPLVLSATQPPLFRCFTTQQSSSEGEPMPQQHPPLSPQQSLSTHSEDTNPRRDTQPPSPRVLQRKEPPGAATTHQLSPGSAATPRPAVAMTNRYFRRTPT